MIPLVRNLVGEIKALIGLFDDAAEAAVTCNPLLLPAPMLCPPTLDASTAEIDILGVDTLLFVAVAPGHLSAIIIMHYRGVVDPLFCIASLGAESKARDSLCQ